MYTHTHTQMAMALEAMADGGVLVGIPRTMAQKVAAYTMMVWYEEIWSRTINLYWLSIFKQLALDHVLWSQVNTTSVC